MQVALPWISGMCGARTGEFEHEKAASRGADWWGRGIRFSASGILGLAGVAKLSSWGAWSRSAARLAERFGVPGSVIPIVQVGVPLCETLVALALLRQAGRGRKFGIFGGFILSVTFLSVRIKLLVGGEAVNCNCLGVLLPDRHADTQGLLVSAVLFLLCAWLHWKDGNGEAGRLTH